MRTETCDICESLTDDWIYLEIMEKNWEEVVCKSCFSRLLIVVLGAIGQVKT